MARREGNDNLLEINDNLSGSRLGVYYRMPTTKERIAFRNEFFQKKKGQSPNATEIRMRYGRKIITGPRQGDFEIKDGSGGYVGLTTETPDWKDEFEKIAADVLELLALHVFELSVGLAEKAEPEPPAGEDEEDPDQD